MPIEQGQIVRNLISSEPVTIHRVQQLGISVSISFTGINTNRASTKVITSEEFQKLELLTTV